jgi:hypothetical protein
MVKTRAVALGLILLCLPRLGASQVCALGDSPFDPAARRARELLFTRHQCNSGLIDFVRRTYRFKEKHWDDGWGWDDCSVNDTRFAFPRIIDAAYVLRRGIDVDLGAWHRSSEYASLPNGRQHDYQHEPEFTFGPQMRSFGGWLHTDRVEIWCGGLQSSPKSIASQLLHEAEHLILGGWTGAFNHNAFIPPHSGCTERCADFWYGHTSPSEPYQITSRHSMNQIEVEFLCDLSTFPQGWVTLDVIDDAAGQANRKLIQRILNPPGWFCSIPRPAPWPQEVSLRERPVDRSW